MVEDEVTGYSLYVNGKIVCIRGGGDAGYYSFTAIEDAVKSALETVSATTSISYLSLETRNGIPKVRHDLSFG